MSGFTALTHNVENAAATIIQSLLHLSPPVSRREEWHVYRIITSLRMLELGVQLGKTLLVDAWPNFTCVVLLREANKTRVEMEVFCRNEPQTIKFLVAWILKWFDESCEKSELRLMTIPDYMWPRLEAATVSKVDFSRFVSCYNFLRREPFDDEPQLPGNLIARFLTEDDLPKVFDKWKFAAEANAQGWLGAIARAGKLMTGVFDGEKMVAQVVVVRQGTQGGLVVDPEFRKLGLGSFLVKRTAKMLHEQGMKIVVEVEEGNEIAKTFFECLNFVRCAQSAYFTIKPLVKDDA